MLLFGIYGFGQEISLATYRGNMNLDGQQHSAYFTLFDFEEANVKRALWDYSVRFAKLDNLRAYYELSVSEEGNKNKIVFLLEVESLGETTKVYIAPKTNPKYLEKSRELLLDFKVRCYSDHFQRKIDAVENEVQKLDKSFKSRPSSEMQARIQAQMRLRDQYLRALYSMH